MSLPSGYTQLEYIKSSGTQYIDTGFKPNQNTRVVMDVTPVDVILGKMWCAFGVRQNGIYFGLYKASTGNMNLTWFYGSNYSNYFTVDYAKRHNLEVNKNAASVDGTSKSYAAQTFQFTIPLFLLCDNDAGSPTSAGAALLYSCQIYDNGTLIRNFIPCKNASGVIGLWDDVNSGFYQNAGSGTFDAGELPKAHKVCINGTGYSATKATMLIDGTGRKAKKGRVLIDGTGYDLKFEQQMVSVTFKAPAYFSPDDTIENAYAIVTIGTEQYYKKILTDITVEVPVGTTIKCWVKHEINYSWIYHDGVVKVNNITGEYTFEAVANYEIAVDSANWNFKYSGQIIITTKNS